MVNAINVFTTVSSLDLNTVYDEKSKTWHGLLKVPKFNANVSLGQIILEALATDPNKIGQISADTGLSMTCGEIRQKTIRAAMNLMKLGYKKGDVFGLYARNTEYLTPIVIAALTIGAPCNAISVSFKKEEISHMFNMTKPVLIFCDNDCVGKLREAMPDLQIPLFTFRGQSSGTRPVEDLFVECIDEEYFVEPDLGDGSKAIALILCTSGTTGFSKGVARSHAAITYQLTDFYYNNEVCMSFSSLYWGSGYMSLLMGSITSSLRIITTDTFSPQKAMDLIEKYKISVFYSTPTMLASMLAHPDIKVRDLSSIKLQFCGGSFVHPELIDQMEKYIPNGFVMIAYGTAELNGVVSLNYPKSSPCSVGQLLHGMQVQIINDDGKRCGINEEGEIYGKPLYPFLGYYNNPEETKNINGEDGFIHTGDIGRLDKNGYLYVNGRKNERFKYGNFSISSSELENLILTIKGVENVCVVFVTDLECMELPAAMIISSGNVTEDDINNLIAENLNDANKLRGGISFVDSIPMTYSGKPLRRDIIKILSENYEKSKRIKDNEI